MEPVGNDFLDRYAIQSAQAESSNELGQDEFLSLMTAQIQNQNPMEPMQNGEFIAQMASFASVEALDQMKDSIETLVTSLTGNQVLRAATLVGHQVMVNGSNLEHDGNGISQFSVMADTPGQTLTVNIFNSSDQLVQRFDVRAEHRGSNIIDWSGLDLEGDAAPAGKYRVEAQTSEDGVTTTLNTAIPQRIRSVAPGLAGADVELRLGNGASISLADVLEIL